MTNHHVPLAFQVAAPSLRTEWRGLVVGALLVLLRVVVVLARPWPLALAVDHALDPSGPAPAWLPGAAGPGTVLLAAALAGAVLTAVLGLLDLAADRMVGQAVERTGASLRITVFDHAMTRSLHWHDGIRSGEVLSRLTTDVNRMLDAFVVAATSLVPDAVLIVVVVALVSALDPTLGLVVLTTVPLLVWLAARQRRHVKDAERVARRESGRLVATAHDLVRNVRVVQAFGRQDFAHATFGERNRALLESEAEAVAVEARWTPAADVALALGTSAVLLVGGWQVLGGAMSVGQLLVVMAYMADLGSPVRGLTRLSSVLAKAAAAAERVQELLESRDAVPEATHPVPAPRLLGGLRLERVSFDYAPGHPVLRDVDLEVTPGEIVCIVGPSGAGKSTLLHLLPRLYDVTDGRVLLDGVDIRDLATADLRSRLAFLPQDAWLLDVSLAENIAFGSRTATPLDVRSAARTALVTEFLDRLPEGFQTVLGQDGVRLSGGQRRRVALARAIVSGAPLLVLDEPTASLDDAAAEEVVEAIRRAAHGRSVVVATHDARLVALADRVLHLDPVRPSVDVPTDASTPELDVTATIGRR